MHKKIFTLKAVPCKILRRENRFVVRVKLRDNVEYAHLTNTGRLKGYMEKDKEGLLIKIDSPKLKYRLIAISDNDGYAIVDTITQNKAFIQALEMRYISRFRGCINIKTNPMILGSKLDYLLHCKGETLYIETKSAVLKGRCGEAMYPDCPTERGRRHIRTLIELAERGRKPILVFIAAFPNPRCIKPNEEGDPDLARLLREALKHSVEILGISIYMDMCGNVYLERDSLPLCRRWLDKALECSI